MTNQHTPGPWHTWDTDPRVILGGDNWSVADTQNHHPLDLQAQQANARLIAAAPELLEALEAAFIQLGRLGGNSEAVPKIHGLVEEKGRIGFHHAETRAAWLQARAAIAKAQGPATGQATV
jgi:hypothetical protein